MKMIQIKVRPRSRVSLLRPAGDGTWVAQVKSPPIDGKANDELVALVAEHFQCLKSAVSIKRGVSGRLKWIRIEGL